MRQSERAQRLDPPRETVPPQNFAVKECFAHIAAKRERIECWRRAACGWSQISFHSFNSALDFLRAFRRILLRLNPADSVRWIDCSVRLARVDASLAAEFFRTSTGVILHAPSSLRSHLLALCINVTQIYGRDAMRDCLRAAMTITEGLSDQDVSARLIEVALKLSYGSLGYCCAFLQQVTRTIRQWEAKGEAHKSFSLHLLDLVGRLPVKLAVDLFEASLPLLDRAGTGSPLAVALGERLIQHTERFIAIDDVGAVRFFICGAKLARLEDVTLIDKWAALCDRFANVEGAAFGNFTTLAEGATENLVALALTHGSEGKAAVMAALDSAQLVAERSMVAASKCYEMSSALLARLSIDAYRDWVKRGLGSFAESNKLIAYFAAESRASQKAIAETSDTLRLEDVLPVLKRYISMLTGKEFPLIAGPQKYDLLEPESDETISLPPTIVGLGSAEERFRYYKVLAAQRAGQIEFGTHEIGTERLRALGLELCRRFTHRPPASLNGETDWRTLINIFPQTALARRLFIILENARIEHLLRARYRGLRRDLDWAQTLPKRARPLDQYILKYEPFLELLFVEALGSGARGVLDEEKRAWTEKVRAVLAAYVRKDGANVADTIRACLELYEYLDPEDPENDLPWENERRRDVPPRSEKGKVMEDVEGQDGIGETLRFEGRRGDAGQIRARPLAQAAWGAPATDLQVGAAMGGVAQPLDDVRLPNAFYYDEWDARIGDYRPRWCRVIEREWGAGDPSFVRRTRVEYSGLIKQMRDRFQLLRPIGLKRVRGQVDGDDIDLEAVVEYVVELRAHRTTSDRIYVERQRRERETAVCFLLDMSGSTSARIAANKRVLDVEKEALLLMSEALNALGDAYAIYGFSSNGRASVFFYRFKDFAEPYGESVANRIGGAKWLTNTRLGAAIRHATRRLNEQSLATRLLIILSDAQPTDDEYSDAHYAREDTRVALTEARASGVFPFCIAFDLRGDTQLDEMFGRNGYTIIQDILRLPEKMPDIYRRLTTR